MVRLELSGVRNRELITAYHYSHSARTIAAYHDHDAVRGHQKPANGRSVRQRRFELDFVVRGIHHQSSSDIRDLGSDEAKTAPKDVYKSSITGLV
jgi:hypothetical protein